MELAKMPNGIPEIYMAFQGEGQKEILAKYKEIYGNNLEL